MLYSWICLNIDSYRRDKYRLYPGRTGRHHPSSPRCAHTPHPAPRGVIAPAPFSLPAHPLALAMTWCLYTHNISRAFRTRGTAKPLRKTPQKESSVATEGWAGQLFIFFPLVFLLCAYGSPQVGSDSQQVVSLSLWAHSVLSLYRQLLWLRWSIEKLKNEDPGFASWCSAELKVLPKKSLFTRENKWSVPSCWGT